MMRNALRHASPRTHDDREVEVPLWAPFGPNKDALPKELHQRLVGVNEGADIRWPVAAMVTLLVILWIARPTVVYPLWMLGVVVLCAALILRQRERWQQAGAEVRETLLGAGRCASCAAELPRPLPDGIIDCQRCRAAWKPEPMEDPGVESIRKRVSVPRDPSQTVVYSPPRD